MFASDGVTPIGGTAPVGTGRSNTTIAGASIGGNEPPRGGLEGKGIHPGQGHRPMLQIDVVKWPFQRASERQPGLSTFFGKAFQVVADFLSAPQPTRGNNKPTREERETVLMGGPGENPDQEARGLTIEPFSSASVVGSETGNQVVTAGQDLSPQEIMNMPADGMTDDMAKQIQGFPTNEHDYLSAFRQSFPAASVNQAPARSRTVVLQQQGFPVAGSFVGEMNIPDGAVTVCLTWTNTAAGLPIDLWWSLTGMAAIPVATNQPGGQGFPTQESIGNDGVLLNPDPTTRYLVKGKRAISFATAVACSVNATFYMQA